MRILLPILAAGLIAVPQTGTPGAQAANVAERFREAGGLQVVDEFVARQMRQDRTPGVALAITSRDAVMMVSTYGFADLRAKVPLTPLHQFEIGSISDSFTAIGLLQQREAGRFDPRASVTTYLPWFTVGGALGSISGHHLLTHTAGIPRGRDDVPSSLFQAAALRDVVPGSKPGIRFACSKLGYQILGYMLSAIAGRPYADVIRDGILRPLAMSSSDPIITHDTRLRLAVGYRDMYDDRPPHVSHPLMPAAWLEYAAGDGAIVSTAEDMAAYARMLLNRGRGPSGPLITPESFALLTQKAAQTGDGEWYGYGLRISENGGGALLTQAGHMFGYSALLAADVTSGVAVVVLTNGPGSPAAIADFALSVGGAVLKGVPLPPQPPLDDPYQVPDAVDYDGTYTSPAGAALRVVAEGERLWLMHRGERVPLERRGVGRFFANHPDFALFLLQFSRDSNKAVTELTFGDSWFASDRYTGPRTFTIPEGWNAYPGHYRTTHAGFDNFRVVLRKGQLWLVSPSGNEQLMVPLEGDEFALDDKEAAERLRFDTIVNGGALRVVLSGTPYYRSFTP